MSLTLIWKNKQTRGLQSAEQNQSHMKYSNNNQENPDPPSESGALPELHFLARLYAH